MNKIPLNIVGLDGGGFIIKKGGGSSGGGGGNAGSDMPVIGDGKTYLYITIANEFTMDIPLSFRGQDYKEVIIDWGDGTMESYQSVNPETATHKYGALGDYVISLSMSEGGTLELGGNSSRNIFEESNINSLTSVLKHVEIGKNTIIKTCAFMKCASLKSVAMPHGVIEWGARSLSYCYSLSSIEIPEGVTSVPSEVFNYCSSLVSVKLPTSITSIASYAFYNCYSLSSIEIPEGVTSVGSGAFSSCFVLHSVKLPKNITKLAERTFYSCYSLSSIEIPEGVTSLEAYVFGECDTLASVKFPKDVTSVGSRVCYGCYDMVAYDFSDHLSVPSLGSTDALPNGSVVVPDALYDEWIAASNWSSLASRIIKKSDWDASQS